MSAPPPEVLYVEDDDRQANLMIRGLADSLPEVELVRVCTEEEAVAILVSPRSLLLAIVDVDLGAGGDGLRAIERTRDVRPELPVLVVTGLGDRVHEHRAVALRSMLVHKPVHPSEIEPLVRHYLQPREDLRLAPYRRVVGPFAAQIELTALEAEVLVLALDGCGRKETAARLAPPRTDEAVKDARRRIVRKADSVGAISFERVVEILRRRLGEVRTPPSRGQTPPPAPVDDPAEMAARPLPFDRVGIGKGNELVLLDVERFLRLPLTTRVRHILQRDLRFFRGDDVVDASIALRALMGESHRPLP